MPAGATKQERVRRKADKVKSTGEAVLNAWGGVSRE